MEYIMMNNDFVCWCCGVNVITVAVGLCETCQDDCDKDQADSDEELKAADNHAENIFNDLQARARALKEQLWSLQENMSFYQS